MPNEVNDGSDQVERVNRGDRTSENTSRDSVISGDRQDHQQIHQEASEAGKTFGTFSDNDDDQSFQAMKPGETLEQYQARLAQKTEQPATKPQVDVFGIDFGDGTIETSKGKVAKPHTQEFFEAKAQGAMAAIQNLDQEPQYQPDQLIAANVTPNNPVVSDATLPEPEEVKENKISETTISQGLPYDLHTPIESGEALRPAVEASLDSGKAIIESIVENAEGPAFPYRGLEDSKLAECTKENPRAWNDAISAIPALSKVGITADHLKAIVRNELHWYDPGDVDSDNKVKKGEQVEAKNTLGHAQISPKGIGEFNRDVPEFSAFLKEKGYKVPGDETKILEDPSCVPMITAAKVASLIKNYESHNLNHPDRPVDINPESLIYGYNADVQRLNQNGKTTYESMIDYEAQGKRMLGYDLQKVHPSSDPQVLGTSKHLRRVLQQLEIVRKPH